MTRYDLDRFKIFLVFYTASLPNLALKTIKKTSNLCTDVILSCVTNRELKKAKLRSKTPIKQLKNINTRITALSRHVCFEFKTRGLEKRSHNAIDVIVFKKLRFRPSTLIRCGCVFILLPFQQRFQKDAFSVKMLSVSERFSVDGVLV